MQTEASSTIPFMGRRDTQRVITIIQHAYGKNSTTEWAPDATLPEIARALCDNDLPDFPVVHIIESYPDDGRCSYVTEDVARLIPAIAEEMQRDGDTIRACAVALAERFKIEMPPRDHDDSDPFDDLSQLGMDNERDRRAMMGVL